MIDILMPRLSDTMTEGTIAAWRKKPGDPVEPGDILVEIETDKALMEQEAYDAGVLVEILVSEGENAEIGTPIARVDDGRDHDPPADPPTTESRPADTESDSSSVRDRPSDPPVTAGAVNDAKAGGRDPASPLVRRLARERRIDLSTVTGSGPAGRIVRADLPEREVTPQLVPAPLAPDRAADSRETQRLPFDAIRQSVAARLTASGVDIPTFTATASADVQDLLALRAQINATRWEGGIKVSVNDLLLRAVASALRTNPHINASYDAEGRGHTLLHGRVNVGFAVASPAGLVVPVVHDADRASVGAIAATAQALIAKAAARTLKPEDMSDATFTISNLGMFGIDHFTAIINPPQGAILAIGAVRDEVALVGESIESRKRLTFTLTADHRIIDGAGAAQFLSTLSILLENPLRVLS